MAVVGRNESARRQRDVIDDVTTVEYGELQVVERVSGKWLDVAGEHSAVTRTPG